MLAVESDGLKKGLKGGRGSSKSPHQSTRGEGGQKLPKIGPHGLRMPLSTFT